MRSDEQLITEIRSLLSYGSTKNNGIDFTWMGTLVECSMMRKVIGLNQRAFINTTPVHTAMMNAPNATLRYFGNFLIKYFKIKEAELVDWRLEYLYKEDQNYDNIIPLK